MLIHDSKQGEQRYNFSTAEKLWNCYQRLCVMYPDHDDSFTTRNGETVRIYFSTQTWSRAFPREENSFY